MNSLFKSLHSSARKLPHLVLLLGLAKCGLLLASAPQSIEGNPELEDAYGLYLRAKMEDLKLTTDPNELGEQLTFSMLQKLAKQNRFDDIFNIGDEAFEKESDVRFGKGIGGGPDQETTNTRLLTHVGGSDSGSCRSCHFKGGPDGSGTITSIAMMRSDGQDADTAILRDSPHVMGLGYIQLVAEEMTATLQMIAKQVQFLARNSGSKSTLELRAKGIGFGQISAAADGSLDVSEVKHVQDDLVVRPFGHKGRAASLFSFVDEALQMHHGLQTDARLEQLASKPEMIGTGPEWDPDADGYQNEAAAGRSLLLAAYLSMLAIPSIAPPKDPELIFAWAEGQKAFEKIGCGSCHLPELRFNESLITHYLPRFPQVRVSIDLAKHHQSPAPIRIDNSPGTDDVIVGGTPIFAYTDLRLHDLGPEMADPSDEPTLDGTSVIDKSLWLTRSLWGIADTAPYLHDGRASTISEAISWHGGDAADVRARFIALEPDLQRSVLVFLSSLTRDPTVLVD